MADNLNVRNGDTFFSSDDEGYDKPLRARKRVVQYYNEHVDNPHYPLTLELKHTYVVWFTYILGGWKAMVSTILPDGRYYEVTHKPEHDGSDGPACTYVDEYRKVKNVRYEG